MTNSKISEHDFCDKQHHNRRIHYRTLMFCTLYLKYEACGGAKISNVALIEVEARQFRLVLGWVTTMKGRSL